MILISVMCVVDNDIFTVVVAILSILLSAFGLGELHLAMMFGIWSMWYGTSKQIPAMLDDRHSFSTIPVIALSLWVAFGGEQKMFTHIRPSISVLLIILNTCVGFTIKDKNKVEIRTAYTILFGLASAGLLFIDSRRNHPSVTGYHLLATTWMITTVPGSIDHPLTVVGLVVRLVFSGLVMYRVIILFPSLDEQPTTVKPPLVKPLVKPLIQREKTVQKVSFPPPPPQAKKGLGFTRQTVPASRSYNSNIVSAFLKNDSDDEYAGTTREKVMEAKEKIKSQL